MMQNTAQRTTNNKRERLIEAADRLIHRKGFNQTTLADIARESGVPLGNVYYYFKTKDDLALQVMDSRADQLRGMFQQWEQLRNPRQRIHAWLDMNEATSDTSTSNGCPIGSLCQELNKSDNEALRKKAESNLRLILAWNTEQIALLGLKDAQNHALHLITCLQGSALLANTLGDGNILKGQIRQLRDWLDNL